MNPFFEWLIKSSISLALLYSVFKLAVSRDKIFIVNRFILLGILVISSIIPIINIPVIRETSVIPNMNVIREFVAAPVNTPVATNTTIADPNVSTVQAPHSMTINPWLIAYLFIILVIFVRLLISFFRVRQIIRSAEKQPFQKIILAIVKDFIQPFSFLQHIIISEKDYMENKDIVVAHEYAHIKNLHAIDLVICELFTAIHWFNPFMWLLRSDLRLIHEYQADQAVLNKGIDEKKYQLLVLEKAVGERRFAMANHFTQKPILKRIKMMKKKNKNRWTEIKLVLFIPATLILLQAFTLFGCKTNNNETKINGTYKFEVEETITNGNKSQVVYNSNTCGLKTWSDKYFLWVDSSPRGINNAGSLGGGTYTLKGNKYTETFEHHASPSFRGVTMKIHLEMKKDTVIEIWPVDQNFNYDKNNCIIQKFVRVD